MGKKLPYILAGVCVTAVLLIVFLRPHEKVFDKRIILDKGYKTPYGLYLAHDLLPLMFAGSSIKENRASPASWYDADSSADGKWVFFLISRQFNPDKEDLNYLYDFVKDGNQVFICTPRMNETAKSYFGLGEEFNYNFISGSAYITDSGNASLVNPPFDRDSNYFNPGYHYATHFTDVDSLHYTTLGKDKSGYPNFIKINAGKGSFYFHSNPLLFSNYFLLYRNNLDYFQKIISLMPTDKKRIIWDEYFVYHAGYDEQNNNSPSPFRVLWSVKAFRWAFSIGLILISLYILLGIKLLQRAVPFFAKPKNETLEFTKTIGRLYFEKGDNTNLAKKMATYLLEYIRNKYFIKTTVLDDDFSKNLASKSGYDEENLKVIVGNLVYIQAEHTVSEQQLADIYESFSKFYKYTS